MEGECPLMGRACSTDGTSQLGDRIPQTRFPVWIRPECARACTPTCRTGERAELRATGASVPCAGLWRRPGHTPDSGLAGAPSGKRGIFPNGHSGTFYLYMADKRVFRIVLASPSDVQAERDVVDKVINLINQFLRAFDPPAILELWRWETDAHPGLHVKGPQGLIDEGLRIEDSDLVIGVFGRRFGTPVSDANSGTEHEVRHAMEAWKATGKPQVMLYFREIQEGSLSPEESEQYQRIQAFKKELSSTDNPLVWRYKDLVHFEASLQTHIWQELMGRMQKSRHADYPLSLLRYSANANETCIRKEGSTELVGDIFLTCTYDGETPAAYPLLFTVFLSVSAPISQRPIPRGGNPPTPYSRSDVVLLEVSKQSGKKYFGEITGTDEVIFRHVQLGKMLPHESRQFQISNLRCATYTPKVFAYVSVTGALVEEGMHCVATVQRGCDFDVRGADGSKMFDDRGFVARQSANLVDQRIATIRFTEGFTGAFKSRAGESCAFGAIVDAGDGNVQVCGLADRGTGLQVQFHHIPRGIRVFVSIGDLGHRKRARLSDSGPSLVPDAGRTINQIEVRELLVEGGRSGVLWEVIEPLGYGETSLDVAVFASFSDDASTNPPAPGYCQVSGGLGPLFLGMMGGVLEYPVPRFHAVFGRFCTILTVLP